MSPAPDPGHRSVLQATVDALVERTRAVAELVAAAGGGALAVLPDPVPATLKQMLTALNQLAAQMPSMTAELDVVTAEVHAKRLSIQALQAELAALDAQLEVLERSLLPIQAWSRQWNRLRHSLTTGLAGPD